MTEAFYVPPAYRLYEAILNPPGSPRRWHAGWNGLIGEPAADVTLGASQGDRIALVTSAPLRGREDGRIKAFMAAQPLLIGDLPRIFDELNTDVGWTPTTIELDGHPTPWWMRTVSDLTLAYSLDHGVAAAWRGPTIALRTVDPDISTEYNADPFRRHSRVELPVWSADHTP